jgi:hypothetical protein
MNTNIHQEITCSQQKKVRVVDQSEFRRQCRVTCGGKCSHWACLATVADEESDSDSEAISNRLFVWLFVCFHLLTTCIFTYVIDKLKG